MLKLRITNTRFEFASENKPMNSKRLHRALGRKNYALTLSLVRHALNSTTLKYRRTKKTFGNKKKLTQCEMKINFGRK